MPYHARIVDEKQAMNIVGPNVRKVRLQNGWSQQQLSNKLELLPVYICRGSISRLEEQRRTITDYEAAGLAKVLGITIAELYMLE